MDCKQVIDEISRIHRSEENVSGLLSKEHVDHLKSCEKCKKALLNFNKLLIILKRERAVLNPYFTDKVMKKLESKTAFNSWKYATAVLSAILLITGVLFFYERNKEITVEFSLELPGASEVSLVGDFNDWNIGALKLKNNGGVWRAKLKIKPGRYQYAFVVDGKKWIADPNSKNYVDSGFGTKNSIVDTTRL